MTTELSSKNYGREKKRSKIDSSIQNHINSHNLSISPFSFCDKDTSVKMPPCINYSSSAVQVSPFQPSSSDNSNYIRHISGEQEPTTDGLQALPDLTMMCLKTAKYVTMKEAFVGKNIVLGKFGLNQETTKYLRMFSFQYFV